MHVGVAQRLRALDAAFGLGPPRTPPPWSEGVGPLRALDEQLESQRRALLVLGGWLLLTVAAVAVRQPWVLVLPVVGCGAGVLLAKSVRHDAVPWRSLSLARPAPADVPRRHRAWWWPYAVGSAVAVPLCALILLAGAAVEASPVGWVPGLSALAVTVTMQYPGLRRGRERLAAWEQEHGVQVLVPVVRGRSPARGGYYLAPDTAGPGGDQR